MAGLRSTYPYQQWQKRVLRDSNGICQLCYRAVDMTLSGMHKWGPVADHIVEVCEGGPMFDPRNGQLAHRWCNEEKERRRRARRKQLNPSRRW